jgi:hypothetical protein
MHEQLSARLSSGVPMRIRKGTVFALLACGAVGALTHCTGDDTSAREARARDWLDMARAGKKREKWPWLSPSCRPKGRSELGGST